MNLVKVISTEIDNLLRRVVKFRRYGKFDIRTSFNAQPFGVDGNPISDLIAVYSDTGEKGKSVLIGYLNRNAVADIGELRLYSTNEDGDEETFIHLKNDGTIELGGSSDNAVRFEPLDSGLQDFKTAIQTELTKIAAGISAAGGSYTPGTLNIDISGAKIDEIKTL